MNLLVHARRAAEAFRLPGTISRVDAYGEGLIHDTFLVFVDAADGRKRYILQRINQTVFTSPANLMQNIERVVSHLQLRAIQSRRDPQREVVSLMQTLAGKSWHESDGHAWRVFRLVEGTSSIDHAPSVEQAHQIGRAFGRFLDDLSDFPLNSLEVALPGYRDTERYLASLRRAVEQDRFHRAAKAKEELTDIESHVEDAMRIQVLQRSGGIPLRVIHGDTKLNNVLLDINTGAYVCVIDLDTVMPGLLLHDIGDCVREALIGNARREDSLSEHELLVFEAIVTGFLSELTVQPTMMEISNIVAGVKSITLELAARFVSDYLSGDVYFKTTHSEQNLDRAKQHLHLLHRIRISERKLELVAQRWVDEDWSQSDESLVARTV